ncbi:MAG TPA: prolyl aminopeptidase [Burkholderiaceae bacterium]
MPDTAVATAFFPPIEPYRHGMLAVDDLHTLYWEECGNPDGEPVLFLHGGPGGGLSPMHRRFFDPAHYRIVLFDQRGAGQSTPLGEFRNNTTQLLIDDIERIRAMLGIERWLVFGGSWGSTLALAYGQAHPQCCTGFVLRGIFLATKAEIEFFLNGMKWFYPELHDDFVAPIPQEERGDLLAAYVKRILSDDPAGYRPAARDWSRFEGRRMFLLPQNEPESPDITTHDIGLGRLETHYMAHAAFLDEDQLIRDLGRIAHLPAVIVQGRYDVICPPLSAYRLHQAWPGSKLQMIADAGHAALEPGITRALVAATEQFKRLHAFE